MIEIQHKLVEAKGAMYNDSASVVHRTAAKLTLCFVGSRSLTFPSAAPLALSSVPTWCISHGTAGRAQVRLFTMIFKQREGIL